MVPPPKTEAQLELERWESIVGHELKRWPQEKRLHLNDLLGKAHQDPKKAVALFGTLMEKLNSIKERMDGHFEEEPCIMRLKSMVSPEMETQRHFVNFYGSSTPRLTRMT